MSARTLIDGALDRLYAESLEGFVALRRSLAAELRAAGDLAGSREIATARKPTRSAWALNRMVRREPQRLHAVFDAHAAAVSAQSSGDPQAMRETVRAFRDHVAEAVKRAADVAAEGRVPLTAAHLRQVAETVRAATAGGAASQEQLLAGRMADDIDVEDPLGGLDEQPLHAPHIVRSPANTEPGSSTQQGSERTGEQRAREERAREQRVRDERDREERERRKRALEDARRQVQVLEQEARQARESLRTAELTVAHAEAEAERARGTLAVLDDRLARARKVLADT